ncbi:MAG: response regulator [Candidatus Omnitrophica bacterium]|nr:response regulator [Candidatus Omnitrophota bacterium]
MPKVLVAPTDLALRTRCHELLTKKGYQAIAVNPSEEIQSKIRLEKPDLVLLEIKVSNKKLLAGVHDLREAFRDLPIIVLSDAMSPEIETAAYEAGANEIIPRHIENNQFLEKIEKIMGAKERLFSKESPKGKILLVDDDENVRRLLTEFFKRKGFDTIQAESGEAALKQIQKEKPAMILLDITMPGMDGITTLRKIREMDNHVGVVMATAIQDDEIARQAMELGAYHYVLKPFDLKYLELVVLTRLVIAS